MSHRMHMHSTATLSQLLSRGSLRCSLQLWRGRAQATDFITLSSHRLAVAEERWEGRLFEPTTYEVCHLGGSHQTSSVQHESLEVLRYAIDQFKLSTHIHRELLPAESRKRYSSHLIFSAFLSFVIAVHDRYTQISNYSPTSQQGNIRPLSMTLDTLSYASSAVQGTIFLSPALHLCTPPLPTLYW
jgi:hypothetical protein